MDILLVLGGILWVVLSAIGKRKQQQQKQAERETSALDRAAQQAQAAAAQRAAAARAAKPAAARPFNPYAPEPETEPTPQIHRPAAPVRNMQPQAVKPGQPSARIPKPADALATKQQPLISNMQPNSTEGPVARTQVSVSSNLTEIQGTKRHTLTASFDTGHAHQETSMSGFAENCPPDSAAGETARGASSVPADFRWDANAVLSGLIYSEILGKPKALRGR